MSQELKVNRNIYDMCGEDSLEVHCGANNSIEIHKYYGPLCADGVKVVLEYTDEVADWVVYAEDRNGNWKEKARWYCQESYDDGGDL